MITTKPLLAPTPPRAAPTPPKPPTPVEDARLNQFKGRDLFRPTGSYPPLTIDRNRRTEIAPDFFIVGAPKCGTSAMAHYLSSHPDVFMGKKEMHFFGSDLQFSPQFYRRDRAAYLAEFAGRNHAQRAGEASVWYLSSTRAAAEIQQFNPESNIIIMLREPAEALYSMYYQFRFDGNEDIPTFEGALAAEEDRRAGRRIPRQAHFARGLIYRETIRFSEQVQRYFDVFGRSRVHVVLYDVLVSDTAAAYREVLDFLGLDASEIPADFKVINGNKVVKNPALRALLNSPRLRRAILGIRPWLPQAVFAALRRADRGLWQLNTRFVKRPPLEPELRRELRRAFAPEVERLGRLLGRDLSHWSKTT